MEMVNENRLSWERVEEGCSKFGGRKIAASHYGAREHVQNA